jgi:hypothetical protein
MSENAEGSSQTISSEISTGEQWNFDQSSVNECLRFIEEYKGRNISKGEALLEIQSILQAAVRESEFLSQVDFRTGVRNFLDILDWAKGTQEVSSQPRVTISEEWLPQSSVDPSVSESGNKEKELWTWLWRRVLTEEEESSESEDEQEYILCGKRWKLTPEWLGFYPWLQPEQYRHLSKKRSEECTLDCYEEWSEDSKYYHGQVTATPGCLSFPLSQWTLLLEGRAPDLEKVLSGHYSTVIDPKQSQMLGKGFEIVLSQPTSAHKVKTYGDWSIATDLWVDALTFIMPWKEFELWGYKRYISGFFVDVHYSMHSRIIDFNKACRLKVEGQKYLRFDSIQEFRQLKITHLSSLGMVAFSELQQLSISTPGSGKTSRGGKKPSCQDSSSWGEACNNWNRGACDKSVGECIHFHVCSKCQGGHKRVKCPMAKAS